MSGLINRAAISVYFAVALVLAILQTGIALFMWLTGTVPEAAGRLAVIFTGTLLATLFIGIGLAVRADRRDGDQP